RGRAAGARARPRRLVARGRLREPADRGRDRSDPARHRRAGGARGCRRRLGRAARPADAAGGRAAGGAVTLRALMVLLAIAALLAAACGTDEAQRPGGGSTLDATFGDPDGDGVLTP